MVSTLKLLVGIEMIGYCSLVISREVFFVVKRVAENGVNSNNDCKEKFT